jgi:hypothetical protein
MSHTVSPILAMQGFLRAQMFLNTSTVYPKLSGPFRLQKTSEFGASVCKNGWLSPDFHNPSYRTSVCSYYGSYPKKTSHTPDPHMF